MPSCSISAKEREDLEKYGCCVAKVPKGSLVTFVDIDEKMSVHDTDGAYAKDVVVVAKHPLPKHELIFMALAKPAPRELDRFARIYLDR